MRRSGQISLRTTSAVRGRFSIDKLLGSAVALGFLLAASSAPAQTPATDSDKAAGKTPPPSPPPACTDCRGGETRPPSSNTVIVEPDGKTIVPRPLMREQSDFRLNDALKNVPGINRR